MDKLSSASNYEEEMNYLEASFIFNKHLHESNEKKVLMTTCPKLVLILQIIVVSILYSLYYCLILSMEKEVELVSSKIFHSVILLIFTIAEYMINKKNKPKSKELNKSGLYTPFLEHGYYKNINIPDDKKAIEAFDKYYIDIKELNFYIVIYGLMSFANELFIYYILSVGSVYNTNIGTMYSLLSLEYFLFIWRVSYFDVHLGLFQYSGMILLFMTLLIIYNYYIPDVNFIMLLGSLVTIILFRFIKTCVFIYIHSKTNKAKNFIRQTNLVDGGTGLLLFIAVILSPKRNDFMIYDMLNLLKVTLATICYYIALKISIWKGKNFYIFAIFASLNYIFTSIFDGVINNRVAASHELGIVFILSFSGIIMFINDYSFVKGVSTLLNFNASSQHSNVSKKLNSRSSK